MSKVYEKGTQVHAVDVFYANESKLYTDEAKTTEAKAADVLKAAQVGKLVVNDGTNLVLATSVKLDGTSVTAGAKTYTVAA